MKDNPANMAIRSHRQVESMASLAQVAQSGAEANSVVVVGYPWSDPVGVWMVVVLGLFKAAGPAGAEEDFLGGTPSIRVGMVHEYGAVGTVIVAVLVNVRFQFAEVREDAFVAPLVIAQGCPGVKILRNAAVKSGRIDGAGAAGNFASGHQHRPRQISRCCSELPVMGAGGQRDRVAAGGPSGRRGRSGGKPVFQLVRQSIEIRIVRSGFQQHHRAGRIFRQPRRQH